MACSVKSVKGSFRAPNWDFLKRSTRIQAVLLFQLLGFVPLLLYGNSSASIILMVLANTALSLIALRKGLLGLALFNGLYSAYLILTLLCFYRYIDIYLLESLLDESAFKVGLTLLIGAQLVFSYPLLLSRSRKELGPSAVQQQAGLDDCVMLVFCGFSFLLALYGYYLYGGVLEFLRTPYDPVFEGAAESSYKHVMISTAGVLNTSIFCYALHQSIEKRRRPIFAPVALLLFCVQVSFFVQGKREYLVETLLASGILLVALRAEKLKRQPRILSLSLILLTGIIVAGLGFAIRSEGVEINQLFVLAIGYEAQFTLATFLNVIFVDHHYTVSYDFFQDAIRLLVIMIPRDFFELLGADKDALMPISNFSRIYIENKGGQFVFTSAYAGLGVLGVFIYALTLGRLLLLVDSRVVRGNLWIYAVSITYLWVLIRKDFILAFKYYFTGIVVIAITLALVRMMVRYVSFYPKRRLAQSAFGESKTK